MAFSRNIALLAFVTLLQHVKGNSTLVTNTTTESAVTDTNVTATSYTMNQTSLTNSSLAPTSEIENTSTEPIVNATMTANGFTAITTPRSETPSTPIQTTSSILNSTANTNGTSTISALTSNSSIPNTISTTVSTSDTSTVTMNTTATLTSIETSTAFPTTMVTTASNKFVSTAPETSVTTPPQIANITTIVEKVQNKWKESVWNLNFSRTSLNEDDASNFTGEHVIETTITFVKSLNASVLKTSIEDNSISDVVTLLLQQPQTSLGKNTTERFNENQTINLHAFYAVLAWLHDQVLCNASHFRNLAESYAPASDNSNASTSGGETVANVTFDNFIRYVLDRALSEPDMLKDAVCNLASQNNVEASSCSEIVIATTTVQLITLPSIPNVQLYEEAWKSVLERSFSFLNETQKSQLGNITSSDMTKSLLDYVKNLNTAEVETLVDTNVTKFISQLLRQNVNNIRDLIGAESADAFSDDTERQDIFYLYLNFLTNLMKDSAKFEATLRNYVGANSKRRKRATACDTETLTADGLVCHIITTEGSNATLLLAGACAEIDPENTSNCTDLSQTTTTQGTPVDNGPSTAVIIGAVVGSVAGFLLLMLLGWFIWVRCNSSKKQKVTPEDTELQSSQAFVTGNGKRSRQSTPGIPGSPGTNEGNEPSVEASSTL